MNYTNKDMVNWLKLTNVKGLGPMKIMKLFMTYNNIDEIVHASNEELLNTRIFKEKHIDEWNKLKRASDDGFLKVLRDCENNGIEIVPMADGRYPKKLLGVPYPPYTLFLKGDMTLLNSDIIAIVGTRRAREGALEWTSTISKEIADNGYTIISGGALGVDTSAHVGAMNSKNGKTIAVLGSGLLRPFPEENIDLFKKIGKVGLLISEHLPNFPGSRFALIQRNRITSGLSRAVILSASNSDGGGMVQSKIAHEQKIPILVPPQNLNLLPNEGIAIVKRKYFAREISHAEDAITLIKSDEQTTTKQRNVIGFF